MTNISVIENKISSIQKYLKTASGYKKYSLKEIEQDETIRGAVERYLYLLAQSVIDLAEAAISFRGYRKPATMAESFSILAEQGIISDELTGKMIRLTGFRNVLAHDYEKIAYGIVYDVLQNRLADVEEFLSIIQRKIF
ncbi:MAG: DUF86 domain-containing protein [Deltaproteobacteria bacterium]|nr:DUF86 domain-containing protein [Deltaproteobacteria bacterium]